jgi:hypothetical protein
MRQIPQKLIEEAKMKKVISCMVAALVALCFAAVACAVPATGDMNSAISVVTGKDEGTKPAKKQVKKRKARKGQKKKQTKKEQAPVPAASEAPTPSSPPDSKY